MITAERLRDLLNYDPTTGVFTWLKPTSNRVYRGKVAGSTDSEGYVQIFLDGKNYRGHRLAWLYMTGAWPKDQVDHWNGDRSCNAWINLRSATQGQNNCNAKLRSDNTSGVKGVSFDAGKDKWFAYVTVGGALKCLGHFDDIDTAARVRRAAAEAAYADFVRHE